VADFMGRIPTMMVVRRFRSLNVRNLLYLQAELADIEEQLIACEKEDANNQNSVGKRLHPRDFRSILDVSTSQDEDQKQLKLIRRMQEKLKEYSGLFLNFCDGSSNLVLDR